MARPRRRRLCARRHAQRRRLPLRRRRSGWLHPVDPAASRWPAVPARQRADRRAVAAVRVRRAAGPGHRPAAGQPRDVVPRALPVDAGPALRRPHPPRRSRARLTLVRRRVRRRVRHPASHRQDQRQHARGLLPSPPAGVRHRRPRPGRGAAGAAVDRARGGRRGGRRPSDDRSLVRGLDRRGAVRGAAAAAAGAERRRRAWCRRRRRPARLGLPHRGADG